MREPTTSTAARENAPRGQKTRLPETGAQAAGPAPSPSTGLRSKGRDGCVPATPQRTCVGCRQVDAKAHLRRVVLDGAGRLVTQEPGAPRARRTLPGRGAYVHDVEKCLLTALTRGGFERSFRRKVVVPPGFSGAIRPGSPSPPAPQRPVDAAPPDRTKDGGCDTGAVRDAATGPPRQHEQSSGNDEQQGWHRE